MGSSPGPRGAPTGPEANGKIERRGFESQLRTGSAHIGPVHGRTDTPGPPADPVVTSGATSKRRRRTPTGTQAPAAWRRRTRWLEPIARPSRS